MCKQPARYYCHKCGTYTTDPGETGHADQKGPICPTCHERVVEVAPPATDRALFCPRCELPLQASDAIPADGAKGPSCSDCGTELVDPPNPPSYPLELGVALKLVGVVARLLRDSGAIASLREYARKTASPLDDLAATIAVAVLKECARF